MVARITGATLRDLSYIAANLRPDDRREIDAQFADWSPALLAMWSLRDHAYVVELDGNPEAAFGATSTPNPGLWIAWSWGTKRMWRCIPRITEFSNEVMRPDLMAKGQRLEARAMSCHVKAHRWLELLGAFHDCTLHGYGRNGEDFELFSWVRGNPGNPGNLDNYENTEVDDDTKDDPPTEATEGV